MKFVAITALAIGIFVVNACSVVIPIYQTNVSEGLSAEQKVQLTQCEELWQKEYKSFQNAVVSNRFAAIVAGGPLGLIFALWDSASNNPDREQMNKSYTENVKKCLEQTKDVS